MFHSTSSSLPCRWEWIRGWFRQGGALRAGFYLRQLWQTEWGLAKCWVPSAELCLASWDPKEIRSSKPFKRPRWLKKQGDGFSGRICLQGGCQVDLRARGHPGRWWCYIPRKGEFGSQGFEKRNRGMPPVAARAASRRRVSPFFLDLFIPSLFLKRCYSHFPQRTYAKRSGSQK